MKKGLNALLTMRRSDEKYGFSQMGVGDTIFVPDPKSDRVRFASWNYGKRHGWKFTCRRGVAGIHVGRIA